MYGRANCDGCPEDQLCDRCYARERLAKRGQADVLGQCWAERICRTHPELREREAWTAHDGKAADIARRLVSHLTRDPRLLEELAVACTAGAAAWWQRRGPTYR